MSRGRQSEELIQGDGIFDGKDNPSDEVSSQHANSVGFVKREHRWSSENSDDCMIMALSRKRVTLLKVVAGPKLKITMNGHPMNIWIEGGSPIPILTMDDLKKTLGRT